jgi:hypothetical protein
MGEPRLKNFRPALVAPDFYSFLSRRGEVTFGSVPRPVSRGAPGLAKDVFLNGNPVGAIELFKSFIIFEGNIPGIGELRRRKVRGPLSDPDDITLSYHEEDTDMHKKGRSDGWGDTVPFP